MSEVEDPELDSVAVETVAVISPPAPEFAGTYAIYQDGAGGLVIVATIVEAEGEPRTMRKSIPAAMVNLINGGGGPVGTMFRRIMG